MLDVKQAIGKAKKFLMEYRDEDYLWRDFDIRNYGVSVDWISAYIGLSLKQARSPKTYLQESAKALLARQHLKFNGWGFDEKVVPDADSTSFAILFLSKCGYESNLSSAKNFLLQHQTEEGSFRTYLPNLIKPFLKEGITEEGWCSGVIDVTATALQVLRRNVPASQYLIKNMKKEGSWCSYWYTNDIYATTQSILSLEKTESAKEQVKTAKYWLLTQNTPNIPFYTALSILGNRTNQEHPLVQKRLENLIAMQEKDGSWESHPVLRFPLPSNKEPWNNPTRLREDAQDQKRIFTTATCLRTLVACSQ